VYLQTLEGTEEFQQPHPFRRRVPTGRIASMRSLKREQGADGRARSNYSSGEMQCNPSMNPTTRLEEYRMRAIFISYRREDAEGQAGRLFNDLARYFGEDTVFMDVAGIEPGRDFRRVIDQHVASCGVLLAMIGKSWIEVADETGRRRLDDPLDFVRLETASALQRDIPVIPVLVHGARMPRAEQLPGDLAELAYRNGVELTHARWDSDVQVLIKALSPYVESSEKNHGPVKAAAPAGAAVIAPSDVPRAADADPRRAGHSQNNFFAMIVAGVVAALVIAGGGYLGYRNLAAKAEIARIANLQRIAAETAKTAERERLALERARQQAESDRIAAEKAKAAEAEKIVAERARRRMEADRIAAEKENAENARRQAESDRIAAEKARVAEAEKIALERSKQAAAQRARWPAYNFPPPNGGWLVYTIMPDGHPACASYDGGGCLWNQTYDQIDFRRLKPLVCGAQHRARWGVTGYENPKHWCTLARRMRADLK
jgi:hypothetical protein